MTNAKNWFIDEVLVVVAQELVDLLVVNEEEAKTKFGMALVKYKQSDDAQEEFECATEWYKQAIIALAEARFTLAKVQRDCNTYRTHEMQKPGGSV